MIKFYLSVLYKLILNVIFLLALGSCIFRNDIGSRTEPDFIVDKIKKSSNSREAITFTPGKDGIKESFTLHLETCINYRKNPDIFLQNSPFIIEYYASFSDFEKRRSKQVTPSPKFTDHKGCIQWEEIYEYKYIHQSVWLGLDRTIRLGGRSNISGKVTIPLAVNPWLREGSSAPQILDVRKEYDKGSFILNDKYKEDGLKFLSEISKKDFPQLWVPDVYIQTSPEPSLSGIMYTPPSHGDYEVDYRRCEETADKEFNTCSQNSESRISKEKCLRQKRKSKNQCQQDYETKKCYQLGFLNKAECLRNEREKVKDNYEEGYRKCKETADKEFNTCAQNSEPRIAKEKCFQQERKPKSQCKKDYRENMAELKEKCLRQKRKSKNQCQKDYREDMAELKEKHDKEVRQWLKSYQIECNKDNLNDCYKRFVEVLVRIPLKMRRYDIYNKLISEDLSGGKYDVNVRFITYEDENKGPFYFMHEEKDENGRQVCNQTLTFGDQGTQENEFLVLSCVLKIPYFNKNSGYQLLMEVRPAKDSNLPFKTFQGIYNLDENFIQSVTQTKNDIKTNIDESYKGTLGTEKEVNLFRDMEIKDILEAINDKDSDFFQPGLEDNGKSEFKYSNIKSGTNCNIHDNGVTRTVVFAGKICLEDSLLNKPYPHKKFRVFVEKPDDEGTCAKNSEDRKSCIEEVFTKDPKTGEVTFYEPDPSGCIHITIPIFNKIYVRQKYIRVIVHVLSEKLNLYARAEPALNPWQKQFQAYVDATKLPDDDIRFSNEGVKKPRMIINQFRSVNMFPSYGIDQFLNINLYHRLYFLFQAFIQRLGDVAHGTFAASREFLRDGYYLVRILLLRNPQETLDLVRVFNREQIHIKRQNLENETKDFQTFKDAEYITHSDMLVKAEANFVNLYTPLFVTTRELYYVASRNLISLEVAPVDPRGFVYHKVEGDGACELNLEDTTWSPYFGDELENNAFLGAFTLSQLTNWNILRPVKNFSSDEIIERAIESQRIKPEYKLFDLREDHQVPKQQKALVSSLITKCIDETMRLDEEAFGHIEMPSGHKGFVVDSNKRFWPFKEAIPETLDGIKSFEKQFLEDNKQYKSQKETYISLHEDVYNNKVEELKRCVGDIHKDYEEEIKQKEKDKERSFCANKKDVLECFASQEALKIVELSGDEGTQFITDINNAVLAKQEYRADKRRSTEKWLKPSDVLSMIPDTLLTSFIENQSYQNDKDYLEEQIKVHCSWDSTEADNKEFCDNLETSLAIIEQDFERGQRQRYQNDKDYLEEQINFQCFGGSIKVGNKKFCDDFKTSLAGIKKDLALRSQQKHNMSDEERHMYFKDRAAFSKAKKKCGINLTFVNDLIERFKNSKWNKAYPPAECTHKILASYIKGLKEEVESAERDLSVVISQLLTDIEEKSSFEGYVQNFDDPFDIPLVQNIIHEKRIFDNKDRSPEVYSFTKSLCHFWFDSYFPNYLETEQTLSAFTNYVRKFDYYKILERNSEYFKSNEEVNNVLDEFTLAMLGAKDIQKTPDHTLYSSCHSNYVDCILVDHCQLRDVNSNKTETYCKRYLSKESETCTDLVREECERDSYFPLCPSKAECEENPDSPLCPSEKSYSQLFHHFKKRCSTAVYDYCENNTEHRLCLKFSSRCLTKYESCFRNDTASIFHPRSIINPQCSASQEINQKCYTKNKNLVLDACLEDPYQFFKFENKLVVYEVSENEPLYKGGLLRNFSISGNFSLGNSMSWSGKHNHSLAIGAGLEGRLGGGNRKEKLDSKGGLRRQFLSHFTVNASLRPSESISSDRSHSSRRSVDTRVLSSAFLSVGEVILGIDVVKFKKCLVIKPNPNAFFKYRVSDILPPSQPRNPEDYGGSDPVYNEIWTATALPDDFRKILISRPGLILCNPEVRDADNPESIIEYYYYIGQQAETSSIKFLNMSDLVNRPFVNVFRGRKEFRKFYRMMKMVMEGDNGLIMENGNIHEPPENMFINYAFPVEEARSLGLAIREFRETGFHPGIYDYAEDADAELDEINQSRYSKSEWILKWISKVNVLDIPKVGTGQTDMPVEE